MISVLIGAASAAYFFAGITSWLVAALELMGHTDNSYMVWLRETSRKNIVFEGLSVVYLVFGWPLHLVLKAAFK